MGDPFGELRNVLDLIDFQESQQNGGKTTRFTASLDPAKLPAEFAAGIEETVNLVMDFDTQSGFPTLIEINGNSGPAFKISTSNLKFPKMIAPSTFEYTAPEGTFVMDLTSMLQMQMDAAAQAENGEF